MHLAVLPGNSALNKPWIYVVEKELKNHFSTTYVQTYAHWNIPDSFIDMPKELSKLTSHLSSIKDDYVIFAKSIGIILILQGLIKQQINPKACIFVGNPANWSKRLGIDAKDVKKYIRIPILFIQQTQDPLMPFSKLKHMIQQLEVPIPTTKEVPGNNHHYKDVTLLKEIIVKFLSGQS